MCNLCGGSGKVMLLEKTQIISTRYQDDREIKIPATIDICPKCRELAEFEYQIAFIKSDNVV